jgi:hypothetical protein
MINTEIKKKKKKHQYGRIFGRERDIRVHGYTTHVRSPTKPSCTPCLAQAPSLPKWVADLPDRRDAILKDFSHFPTLQAYMAVLSIVLMDDDLAKRAG